MDDSLNARLEQLKDELIAAADEVSAALEEGEDQRQLAAGRAVEALAKRWAALEAEVPAEDRERVERTVGRRVTDLRRAAAALTRRQAGAQAERSADAGFVPFLERRVPGKSIVPQRAAPTRDSPKFSVGGEVESWCGKCRDMRQHNVVAMVGDQPKQVICQTCRSRHGYRSEPIAPRGGAASESGPPAQSSTVQQKRTLSAAEREIARKQELKRLLIIELDAAAEPRKFDPKGRYKAGEIIVHPEHGRGKIENVLKGSLLVRFREGLRPLNLA